MPPPVAESSQGGVLSGDNPTQYQPTNPMRLWIIQLCTRFATHFALLSSPIVFFFPVIIVGMTQLLAYPLGKIKQPRVIAEVIGGIVLGPTGPFPPLALVNPY